MSQLKMYRITKISSTALTNERVFSGISQNSLRCPRSTTKKSVCGNMTRKQRFGNWRISFQRREIENLFVSFLYCLFRLGKCTQYIRPSSKPRWVTCVNAGKIYLIRLECERVTYFLQSIIQDTQVWTIRAARQQTSGWARMKNIPPSM